MNAHVTHFQASYYNDGGVRISDTHLGDGEDRNYTGGAVISYTGKYNTPVNLVELSYQKFTGYTKNAFDISNTLFLNYMNYHTPEQRKYNKSLWSLNAGNVNGGWSVKLSNYNKVSWDMQHYIHLGLFNTFFRI